MQSYITYTITDAQSRSDLSILADGTRRLVVTESNGHVSLDDSTRVATPFVEELLQSAQFLNWDMHSNSNGQAKLVFGDTMGNVFVRRFDPQHPPQDLWDVLNRLRRVPQASADVSVAGRINATLGEYIDLSSWGFEDDATPVSLITWSAAFFAGHFIASVIGLAALMIGVKSFGLGGLIGGIVALLGCVGLAYFGIGAQIGALGSASRERLAFVAAWLAIVIPALVTFLFGDSTFAILPSLILPWIATMGVRFGARKHYRSFYASTRPEACIAHPR